MASNMTTISVRNISSLNPLKRMKFKENQVMIPDGTNVENFDENESTVVLKRKIPLGTLGSIENVMYNTSTVDLRKVGSVASPGPGRRKNSDAKSTISAVERRNARERNRVQQVNNGFAALRQRIPEEIAEVFEAGTTRGVHKKLSKVETLRMAVEYIKCLERLLSLDPEKEGSVFKFQPPQQQEVTQLPATPPPEPVQANNFFLAIKPRAIGNSNGASLDQTQITIINGHQYIRIPGTNTFQYLDPESLYDDSPNDSSFFGDSSSVMDQDVIQEDSDDLMSESAIAFSPQSNYALEPEDHKAGSPVFPIRPMEDGKILSMIDQQQYADIMMIKSELEEDDEQSLLQRTANDPGFLDSIDWFESHHQQLPSDSLMD